MEEKASQVCFALRQEVLERPSTAGHPLNRNIFATEILVPGSAFTHVTPIDFKRSFPISLAQKYMVYMVQTWMHMEHWFMTQHMTSEYWLKVFLYNILLYISSCVGLKVHYQLWWFSDQFIPQPSNQSQQSSWKKYSMAQYGRRGMVYTESQKHSGWKSPPISSDLTFAPVLTKVKLVPLVVIIFSRILGQVKGNQWISANNPQQLLFGYFATSCLASIKKGRMRQEWKIPNSCGTFTAVEKLMRTDSFLQDQAMNCTSKCSMDT